MTALGSGAVKTREDWEAIRDHRPPPKPTLLSPQEHAALDDEAREDYDEARARWHADFGVGTTPMLKKAMEAFMLRGRFNARNQDPVKAHIALSGAPTLGKTTIARALGREYERWLRRRLEKQGDVLNDADEICLVVYVTLTAETTTRSLNEQIAFYLGAALSSVRRYTNAQMETLVAELLGRHQVRLLIIDDLHLLRAGQLHTEGVRNYLKALSSRVPVMLLLVGIDLKTTNLFEDPPAPAQGGRPSHSNKSGQMGGRSALVPVARFKRDSQAWKNLVGWAEDRLVLEQHQLGTLRALHEYLWDRTQGGIGSLMLLLRLAADLAAETKHEKLDRRLLAKVQLDYNAEKHSKRDILVGQENRA